MSHEVAIRAETTISPQPLPVALVSLISEKRDGIDRWLLRRALTEAERAGLSNEAASVERRLAPTDDEKRRQIIARMLLSFRSSGDGKDELAGYVFATSGFPAWAITEACGRVLRGEVERDNHEFAPKPPTLANIIKGILQPWQMRCWELRRILSAEAPRVTDDAERKRNCERVKALLGTFSAPSAVIK